MILEDDLAQRFGVSKTPVRSALAQLEQEGFVSITPHKETRVSPLSLDDLWEMYVTKNAIEGFCVRRLAGQLTKEQVDTLRAILARTEAAIARGDDQEVAKGNEELHQSFVIFFGNRRFVAILTNLRDHLQRGRAYLISRHIPDQVEIMHRYHAAIAEAVIGGDGVRAEELLHEHNEVFFGMLRESHAGEHNALS